MHKFTDLISGSSSLTVQAIKEAEDKIHQELRTSGSTCLVRGLQNLTIQKAIYALGLFSVFEAILQVNLGCDDGLETAKSILSDEGETDLHENFCDLSKAVNVLKHGRGRSYKALFDKATQLSFRVKHSEDGYSEGNVSEVNLLIDVDYDFIDYCAGIIRDVSKVIERARPDYFG